MAQRSLKKMMATVTNPNFMDKMVLVVAVLGCVTAMLMLRSVPTEEEVLQELRVALEEITTIQTMTNKALEDRDYYSACVFQQRAVDLALEHNLPEDLVDKVERLEDMICGLITARKQDLI